MSISKELLSEVIGVEVIDIYQKSHLRTIWYSTKLNVITKEINKYELANECKEWAYRKHKICLMSTLYAKDVWVCSAQGDEPFAESNTEPEAIFLACEWIQYKKDK
jgi:outer membrane phospholipase A